MRVKELVAFIKEREAIRVKKEAGKPRPWTKDPILDKYRFCNVHREDDRMTRQLRGLADVQEVDKHPDAWFWWVAARLFNKDQTMAAIDGATLPFKPGAMRRALKKQRETYTIFNAAYIVSTNGVAMDKVDYLIDRVLTPLWADRKRIRPDGKGWKLVTFHNQLMNYSGLGSFIAAQVVADLKYMEPLKSAPDWWTFAASGPGSRRGLNVVLDRPMEASWREQDWRAKLQELREAVLPKLGFEIHAQDLQNCLCEYSKYSKVKLGLGVPKQLYHAQKS